MAIARFDVGVRPLSGAARIPSSFSTLVAVASSGPVLAAVVVAGAGSASDRGGRRLGFTSISFGELLGQSAPPGSPDPCRRSSGAPLEK